MLLATNASQSRAEPPPTRENKLKSRTLSKWHGEQRVGLTIGRLFFLPPTFVNSYDKHTDSLSEL